jgi:hypothetical protein
MKVNFSSSAPAAGAENSAVTRNASPSPLFLVFDLLFIFLSSLLCLYLIQLLLLRDAAIFNPFTDKNRIGIHCT